MFISPTNDLDKTDTLYLPNRLLQKLLVNLLWFVCSSTKDMFSLPLVFNPIALMFIIYNWFCT